MKNDRQIKTMVHKVYCTPNNGGQAGPHYRYFSTLEKAKDFVAHQDEYFNRSYVGYGKEKIYAGEIDA